MAPTTQLSYAPQAYNGESDRSTPYFGNTTISPSRPSARIAPAPVRQAVQPEPDPEPVAQPTVVASRGDAAQPQFVWNQGVAGTARSPPPRSPKRRRGSPWFPYRPRGRPTCCRPSSRPCRCRRPGRSCWPPPIRELSCPARRSRIASAGRDHGRNRADVCDLSPRLRGGAPADGASCRHRRRKDRDATAGLVRHGRGRHDNPTARRGTARSRLARPLRHHAPCSRTPRRPRFRPRARRSGWPWPARSRPTRISPRTP